MNISFVIPVLNGEAYIKQCLESIYEIKTPMDDITVVDNGSTDRTIGIVKSYESVTLLERPGLTVSAMRNHGAASTNNEVLAFIDADCVVDKEWRKRVISDLSDESIHAVGSLVDVPDDACWIEKAWFSQKPDKKQFADYLNTGNLVVRRHAFDSVNGFDEELVSDEDCDFGERFNSENYRMLEDPAIRAVHLDNPKTLKAFYQREAWHATSVLKLNASEIFNKPTIMTILFGLTTVLALIASVMSIWYGRELLLAGLLVLSVPVFTAFYRAHQFKKYQYIPHLSILWGIFYLVRLINMFRHIFSENKATA